VMVSVTFVHRATLYASEKERAVFGYYHLTGPTSSKWQYHQLWYTINMPVPVRLSV
jgi:hypothetical protein